MTADAPFSPREPWELRKSKLTGQDEKFCRSCGGMNEHALTCPYRRQAEDTLRERVAEIVSGQRSVNPWRLAREILEFAAERYAAGAAEARKKAEARWGDCHEVCGSCSHATACHVGGKCPEPEVCVHAATERARRPLVEALRQYGRHDRDCPTIVDESICNCGFSDALLAAGEP
jgi:hypothetical protein